jgi:hypothetical protein
MNFLLDHDVPDDLSFLLVQLGHEVTFLRHALPVDSPDEVVLDWWSWTFPSSGAAFSLPVIVMISFDLRRSSRTTASSLSSAAAPEPRSALRF